MESTPISFWHSSKISTFSISISLNAISNMKPSVYFNEFCFKRFFFYQTFLNLWGSFCLCFVFVVTSSFYNYYFFCLSQITNWWHSGFRWISLVWKWKWKTELPSGRSISFRNPLDLRLIREWYGTAQKLFGLLRIILSQIHWSDLILMIEMIK